MVCALVSALKKNNALCSTCVAMDIITIRMFLNVYAKFNLYFSNMPRTILKIN